MPLYQASLVALTGIAIYVAIHYAWIGRRWRESGTHLVFSALAAVLAVYGLVLLAMQAEPQLARAYGGESLVWLCEMSGAGLLLAFVARFTGRDHRRIRYALTIGLALCAVAAVVLPEGLRSGPAEGLRGHRLPWGEEIYFTVAPYGTAYAITLALVASSFALASHLAWQAWRSGRAGRQLALLIALGLIACAVLNSVVADLSGWQTVPVIAHSFILLTAIMGHCLSVELARTSELEARLRRAEQFAAVGRLAGGVAHDFGNILTGVLGHAELLNEHVGQRQAGSEQVQAIITAAERGNALTRQLLAFARGSPETPPEQGVDAHIVLREVAGLVRSGAANIEVRLELTPEAAGVACDPTQLHAALLNLAVNARDAMPHGGVLRIASVRRDPPAGLALRHQPTAHPLLEIAVSDTGMGIPAHVLPHIFDLQYSTKGAGGTGLGLPQVDEMVQRAGGGLVVETAAGRGTTIRLWLPLREQIGSGMRPPAGSRILLVAGNTTQDQMLASGLGQLGYEVTRLEGGGGMPLTAAVIDIDHAGDGGLAHVRALQDHLPVVVLADVPAQWTAGDATIVVAKPADLTTLGKALRRAEAAGRRRASPAT